ncbi:MAG: hypothetical protein XE11_0380 [Methanomicrobiales archaeon 53_19]|nr:MAG: hypothetical protein XD88_0446 [Methanocalculus sp. 52_23]KUL04600.1 MAG: hypothetical protein XE11_0380 [Methanomicrobiales archaeon 53_19]
MHGNTIIFILYASCPWWHHKRFLSKRMKLRGHSEGIEAALGVIIPCAILSMPIAIAKTPI